MKRLNSILAGGLILAIAGLATFTNAVKAAAEKRDSHATVRAVHGTVNYSTDNGATWMALRPNTELSVGAMIKTDADGQTDLQVNGRTSTVRVNAGTTMTLKTMDMFGSVISPDTETQLDMAQGDVQGSVKKITGESSYHVSTPRGVAGIRGTDFAVKVVANGNGFTVTFTSVTGEVVCVASIRFNGVPRDVSKILTSHQSWTPPDSDSEGDIVPDNQLPIIFTFENIMVLPPVVITYVPPRPSPGTVGGSGNDVSGSPAPTPPDNNDD